MTKRALLAVAGFLSLCSSLLAQEIWLQQVPFTLSHPGPSGMVDTRAAFSTLNRAYYGFPSLTFSDGRRISLSSAYNWIEPTPTSFLPAASAGDSLRASTAATSRQDSTDKAVELRPKFFDYAGGEVDFLYGRSTGKFGREVKQGYIIGETGNDKVHITVGAFYEESSGRVPRLDR